MKKLLFCTLLLMSYASLAKMTPPNILYPTDYESDTEYQACAVPEADKSWHCTLLIKNDFSIKPDGRVVGVSYGIHVVPTGSNTYNIGPDWSGLITVNCVTHNISYKKEGMVDWTDWEYKEPGLISRMVMDKLCSLH